MKRIRTYAWAGFVTAALAAAFSANFSQAQELEGGVPAAATPVEGSWYGETPPPRVEKQSYARQKAMLRGEQRIARLEAMRWYGFSNSRPTATAIPFTGMYSPAWQMPGGRPFAWYTSSRPIVIYTGARAVYR